VNMPPTVDCQFQHQKGVKGALHCTADSSTQRHNVVQQMWEAVGLDLSRERQRGIR
jgi:uncharacterized ferritin-like protein (DUF455 family)